MDESRFHHEWYGQTTLHPVGLVAVVVLGMSMLMLPRRYAVVPMIVLACFIAPAQRLVIFALDFNLLRVMVLFGWARLFLRNDFRGFTWKPIDYVLIAWAATGTAAHSLLHADSSALIYKLGDSFDAIGMYFLFRFLIRDWVDIRCLIGSVVVISIPVAIAILIEKLTGRNAFSVFGGVPEITMVREGKLRAQGAFAHPILAGCFWAALLPLMAAYWWRGGVARWLAILGVGTAVFIVVACASSTPLMAVITAILGAVMFALRHWMRWVRWSVVFMLLNLHMIMKAPVWQLIARVDLTGGSTGWHRYELIDQAIRRVGEWWLVGTQSTAHWGWGLEDVTNQYVFEGVRGGLLTLLLFTCIIALAFQSVGRLVRAAGGDRKQEIMAWSLGVALFVHVMNFVAVSYFGQIIVIWYLLLAMIASLDRARWVKQPSPATCSVGNVARESHNLEWQPLLAQTTATAQGRTLS